MQEVEYDTFLEWAKYRFPDLREGGGKIRLNSIFVDDQKQHLWCRPETNQFKCFKSGQGGSLYKLVMQVDRCSYQEAVEILGGSDDLRYLESRLELLFGKEKKVTTEEKKPVLPPSTFFIKDLTADNHYRQRAEKYLRSRGLPIDGLMVCVAGEFTNRIVIPYCDKKGEVVYFNARDLTGRSRLRYRGPDKGVGLGKEEVLWTKVWRPAGNTVYLTEGEFDALTLEVCGFHAVAGGGKEINIKQLSLLNDYKVILSPDNDVSGHEALKKIASEMLALPGHGDVWHVTPPDPYKDWNEMYLKVGENVLRAYIQRSEKKIDYCWGMLPLDVLEKKITR